MKPGTTSPEYLKPYRDAARVHGDGFGSLLWASPRTQRARFAAIASSTPMKDRIVLDVGCGRADLLSFLVEIGQSPSQYVGLEAVSELAACARSVVRDQDSVIEADFVKEPGRLLVGADVIVVSGALNTLGPFEFERSIELLWKATARALVFNFLAHASLAQADYLYWHDARSMLAWAKDRTADATLRQDYLEFDATIAMFKQKE